MSKKENTEYIELLEKSVLVLHQKQLYQQEIMENPKHPQKKEVLTKIDELQDEIEVIIGAME